MTKSFFKTVFYIFQLKKIC